MRGIKPAPFCSLYFHNNLNTHKQKQARFLFLTHPHDRADLILSNFFANAHKQVLTQAHEGHGCFCRKGSLKACQVPGVIAVFINSLWCVCDVALSMFGPVEKKLWKGRLNPAVYMMQAQRIRESLLHTRQQIISNPILKLGNRGAFLFTTAVKSDYLHHCMPFLSVSRSLSILLWPLMLIRSCYCVFFSHIIL